MSFRHALLAAVLGAAAGAMPAHADLLGNLKSQVGSGNAGTGLNLPSGLGGGGGAGMAALGLPAIGGNTASNAAGVIEYCVKNNYLQGGSAQSVKERLLGKVGLGGAQTQQDAGYQSGLSGMLKGSNGSSFDMGRLQSRLKEKACDYVLQQGQSLL